MADQYDDIMNRMAAQQALTSLTVTRPAPDAAAKANALARTTGVPPETADRNLAELHQQVEVARAKQLFDRHPSLATWAGNPRNAAVGADEMPHLAATSSLWDRLAGTASAVGGAIQSSVLGLADRVDSALTSDIGWQDVAPRVPAVIRTAPSALLAGVASNVVAPMLYATRGVEENAEPLDVTAGLQRRMFGGTLEGYVAGTAQRAGEAVDQFGKRMQPRSGDWLTDQISGGISNVPSTALAMGLGIIGKAAGLTTEAASFIGALSGGVAQGGSSYQKGREQGLTPQQAGLYGLADAATETGGEYLGELPFLRGTDAGAPALTRFLRSQLGEQVGENASTVAQDFTAWVALPENRTKTLGDFAAQLPGDIASTVVQTLVAGGLSNLTITAIEKAGNLAGSRARQATAERVRGAQATAAAEALDKAMQAAADSKTRARDPEAFKQLVGLHTEGTPLENIFVPAESVATYFQSMGMDYHVDDFWGSYSDQIDEALHTGGDVVLPTADAAAHLAGTPAWEALRPDVRTSPGGVSMAEAQSLEAAHGEAMQKMGAQVAEDMEAARRADEPRQKVYQDIRDKLTNAGYTQDAAHTNAELVAQRYATRAERTGKPLAGDETQNIQVNAVLPPNLAPILAADPGQVGLKSVVNVMRGKGANRTKPVSLVDWIAKQGGIEDRGGDLKAMGAAPIKGVAAKGARKLIRPHGDAGQGSLLGADGQQNTNSPDELAMRAQEAGYFPAGDRPTVNDLLDAIGGDLRGTPHYAIGDAHDSRTQSAADELAQILDQSGLDPAKATDAEIGKAIDGYRQAAEGGYQQTFADGPRGQIRFETDGRSVVDLFQSRNMSTFAHEMGHQWLEELRADAEADSATDQAKADWQAVQDWFKANGHAAVGGAIPVDAHELWARGTERFLMEGKSPSATLRRVFDAFKSWLLNIYHLTDNLNAPITPEIREVMQRLIATDDEIAAASEREHLSALFTDAAAAGMTEAEFAAYQLIASQAKDEAHDALLFKTMAAIRRQRTKAWKDEETGVRSDTATRVNARPEFKALHLLRTGRMLDDPEAEPIKVRLDKEWLLSSYGDGILASLPKGVPPIYADTNTTNADDVAEMVGFGSGDEMVRMLVTIEDRTRALREAGDKRSVRQVLVDEETAAEMRDRHGDVLNDGSIEEEALAAVHSDKQGEVIAAELRSLGRRSNRQPTPYSLAKEWARTKIAESTVQEATSGAAIQRYARAAAKAGKAAETAMQAQDIDETYRQKQAQMLNNALIAEAGRMRDAVNIARDRLAGYAKRRTIKSMDQDYLERIHDLLERVEFKTRTQASIDRQGSFEEWAQARAAEGHDVIVPASFAASLGSTHWSRLTVEKLLGLDDTVQQIAHLGRFKQKLLDGQEEREYAATVDEALAGISQLPPRPPSDLMEPDFGARLKGRVASFDASLLKMETVFDWLDGGNAQGVFNRVVFQPIASAQAREADMLADYSARIRTAMEAVPGEDVKRWMDKVQIPELINRETGNPFVLTRQQLVAIALNVGNEGNLQRLTDGYGWNREGVMAALNREMSAGEWQFVQSVWDTIDTLWPEIAAMERRVNGVEPDKVEATAVQTAGGTLRGGYYPAIYDAARDLAAERNARSSADLLETTYTRATTRASSTKDRTAKVKRPILLQLGVINRHLGEVIHDITHRETLMNADKFLSDTRIAKAVNETLGPEIRKQFRPWLKFVANQWAMERTGNEGIGKFINKARANTTAVGMGFRLSTIVTQIAGYSNSFEVVGARWVSQAMTQVAAHPIETFRFVTERSGEVRHRMDTLDRDINAGIKQLAGQRDLISDAKRFAFHGIGYTDRMVVLPTWIGAYNKTLASGAADDVAIYEADKAVRQSQGAGAAKDLAAIQRGTGKWGELLKITTMFYSYLSAVYQRQRTLGRDVSAARRASNSAALPGLMARAWWLLIVPPLLSEMLAGRGPDDDEDWGVWAFKQMVFQMLGPIPFVRDLAKPIWDGVAGTKSFGYQLSPMQRAGDTIVNLSKDVGRKAHGEDTKRMTQDALETVGYATGVVPGQIASATQFLVDVGYGDQDPQTAADWYRGLTTGKAEKRH